MISKRKVLKEKKKYQNFQLSSHSFFEKRTKIKSEFSTTLNKQADEKNKMNYCLANKKTKHIVKYFHSFLFKIKSL